MWNARSSHFAILYPELGTRTGQQIIQAASDYLATEYMRANPHAEQAAIDENARVSSVSEAMGILSDAGVMTFTQAASDSARFHDEQEARLEQAEKAQGVQ